MDVAIVGAGIAGLSAALYLIDNSPQTSLIIVEANNRVGGRMLVEEDGSDLGAAFVGPYQDHLMRLIDRYDLKLYKVPTEGRTAQLLNGHATSYEGEVPAASYFAVLDLNKAMVRIEELESQLDVEHPERHPRAEEFDHMTVDEWIRRELISGSGPWKKAARDLLIGGIKTTFCCDPSETSVLGFLWGVKTNGGLRKVFSEDGGLQDSKVVGGAGQVPLLQAKEIMSKRGPESIKLQYAVKRIELVALNDIRVECWSTARADPPSVLYVKAKKVVMAIPPHQQLRIEHTPAMPGNRLQALQRWPMGHVIKTLTFYEKPYWREHGLNGLGLCDEGIALVCMDDTKPTMTKGCLVGFVVADAAAQWSTASKDERKATLAKHYAKLFKDERMLTPCDYKEKNWAEEPWVGGCYCAFPLPGAMMKYKSLPLLFEPYQKAIYPAGTEFGKVSVGCMDGAVESGERAARNILIDSGRLSGTTSSSANRYDKLEIPEPSPKMPRVDLPPISFLERHLPSSNQLIQGTLLVALSAAAGVALRMWSHNS